MRTDTDETTFLSGPAVTPLFPCFFYADEPHPFNMNEAEVGLKIWKGKTKLESICDGR